MEAHESLPYIDGEISQAQRDAATKLLQQELSKEYATKSHATLADPPTSRLTPLMHNEVERVKAGKPLVGGIDLSRYEGSDEVSQDSNLETVTTALRMTYANISYLRDRQSNIALLEEYGKNSWLIGNSHLEDLVGQLDRELERVKAQSEATNRARKALQEDAQGELIGLAETWNRGIDKIIQTQLASDSLQRELAQLNNSAAPAT